MSVSTIPADGLCLICRKRLRYSHTFAKDHPGTVRHAGKGVCSSCKKAERLRSVDPTHGRQGGRRLGQHRRAEEVLEDWVIVRDRLGGADRLSVTELIGEAARAMDMTYSALEKHLERARRRGDERGNVRCFNRAWAA